MTAFRPKIRNFAGSPMSLGESGAKRSQAIALFEIRARRQDLKIGWNVQPRDPLTTKRDCMINVELNSIAVQFGAMGVNLSDSLMISPSRRLVHFGRTAPTSLNGRFGGVPFAKHGSSLMPAVRRIRKVSQGKAASPDRSAMIPLTLTAGLHSNQSRESGPRLAQFRGRNNPATPPTGQAR